MVLDLRKCVSSHDSLSRPLKLVQIIEGLFTIVASLIAFAGTDSRRVISEE